MSGRLMDRKGRKSDGLESLTNGEKHPRLNGYTPKYQIVCPEMGYYCFDSLLRHLNRQNPPRARGFPDER